MKKLLSTFLCMFMILSATPVFSAAPITVYLNGIPVEFDQEPEILNDRTFVPVRQIFEAMGATINWNGDTKTVTSSLNEKTVTLIIGESFIYVDGQKQSIDAAPQIKGGRTLVPARAVSESYDCTVDWDSKNRSVIIKTKDFSEKIKNAEKYSSVEMLTYESQSAISAFSVEYFSGFQVKTNAADGTKIELSHDTETAHANLSIRTDVYIGDSPKYTDEYTKSVADSMIEVVSGKLISYDVVSISGTDFMKIEYSAPRIVSGITDYNSDITVYMGLKDGVMYTITLSCYGDVARNIIEDLHYTIDSILIA